MSRTFSLKDVAEHSNKECPWFIIKDKVYDVTKLLDEVSSRRASSDMHIYDYHNGASTLPHPLACGLLVTAKLLIDYATVAGPRVVVHPDIFVDFDAV